MSNRYLLAQTIAPYLAELIAVMYTLSSICSNALDSNCETFSTNLFWLC